MKTLSNRFLAHVFIVGAICLIQAGGIDGLGAAFLTIYLMSMVMVVEDIRFDSACSYISMRMNETEINRIYREAGRAALEHAFREIPNLHAEHPLSTAGRRRSGPYGTISEEA